jgi:hypothetical protein
MKAISKAVSNFLNKFELLIEATTSYQQALKELTPLFNKAKPAEQIEIRNSVATLIGVKYGVVPKVMEQGANKGLLGFDSHGSKAEQNARDILRKGFPLMKSVGQNPTVRKASKVTPVERIKARVTKFVKQAKKSDIQERLDELAIELKLLKQFV